MTKASLASWLLAFLLLQPSHATAGAAVNLEKHFAVAPRLQFDALDLQKLAEEDEFAEQLGQGAQRYAVPHDVEISPSTDGRWWQDAEGRWIWHFGVAAIGAVHLNFGFSDFALPPGAQMWIRGIGKADVLGPYTDRDQLPHGDLWTPVLQGDRALIEIILPVGVEPDLPLMLRRIAQGYRGFGHRNKACKSGECQVDVACLDAEDPWRTASRAVGLLSIGGSSTCSGTLLNNTRNDRRMLFATGYGCIQGPSSAISSALVYWRYQSTACRTPGAPENAASEPLPALRATPVLRLLAHTSERITIPMPVSLSDWALLELATPPDNNKFDLYWAGWDRVARTAACRGTDDPASTRDLCASMGHPSGRAKAISFIDKPLAVDSYGRGIGDFFLAEYDLTPPLLPAIQPPPQSLPPSSPSSTGSPLFNERQQVIGLLKAGWFRCEATSAPKVGYFGGLFDAWEGSGTADSGMRDWLDPLAQAPQRIEGLDSRRTGSLSVTIESPAFAEHPAAGETITLRAVVAGGDGNYRYEWAVGDDSRFQRSDSQGSLSITVPAAGELPVHLRVRDGGFAEGTTARTLQVRGPAIIAAADAPQQICGNNDGNLDPGEHWRLPVTLGNTGSAPIGDGHALFALAAPAVLEFGPNVAGYEATANPRACVHDFVDIAEGEWAVPALALSNENDGRTVEAIALAAGGVPIYGQRRAEAVMSTNGYVAFNPAESGRHAVNNCEGFLGSGATGPQLRVYHDDLMLRQGGGLRYRYFERCPRQPQSGGPQGCHVFQWSGMTRVDSGFVGGGNIDFQALVYAQTGQIVYQYRGLDPLRGGSATVGLSAGAGNDPLTLSCNTTGGATDGGSYCIYPSAARPSNQPLARLQRATLPVPPLAIGQEARVDLTLEIDPAAACGTPVDIEFVAAADRQQHSAARREVFLGATAPRCTAFSGCSSAPSNAQRGGLYFNASRPGNGLNAFYFGAGTRQEVFGGLWYTALPDRTPSWLIMSGATSGLAGSFPLLRVDNAAAPSGFRPVEREVGTAWIAPIDTDTLFFAWELDDGGSAGAEVLDATEQAAPARENHTQAWSNGAEPGWGVAIESLGLGAAGDFEFFAGYVFDDRGVPRWVIGNKPNTASGEVPLQTYDVHCPGCPFFVDQLDRPRTAGTLDIQYAARNRATLSTRITLPAPLNGSWTRNSLNIVPIADPQP